MRERVVARVLMHMLGSASAAATRHARSEHRASSRLPHRVSSSSCGSMPAMGLPVRLRTLSMPLWMLLICSAAAQRSGRQAGMMR